MDRLASIRGKASTKTNSFVECSRFMALAERQDRKRVLSRPVQTPWQRSERSGKVLQVPPGPAKTLP
jgi:hypothetical protein